MMKPLSSKSAREERRATNGGQNSGESPTKKIRKRKNKGINSICTLSSPSKYHSVSMLIHFFKK